VEGEKVSFKSGHKEWQFLAPVKPDSIATIIELVMEKPVKGVLTTKNHSVFEGIAYGAAIENREIASADWKKSQYILDLKKSYKVTGIGVYDSKNSIVVRISSNGKNWTEVGKISASDTELSLTTDMTGAQVLGRDIRYVQLTTAGEPSKTKIMVYSK